ncbi:hypothetical protein P9112_004532 [Eukaryota sp. TZLM1-RC]
MSSSCPIPQLTSEQAKEAASLVRDSFRIHKDRIVQAKAAAGDDFVKFLSSVVPIIVEIQGENMHKYGFPQDQSGIMQFMGALGPHMADPDVSSVVQEIRGSLFPNPGQ